MKKYNSFIFSGFILLFLFAMILYHMHETEQRDSYYYPESAEVKPGQTWGYLRGNSKNPFKGIDTVFFKVIDVQDGYVLYSYIKYDSEGSSTIEKFKLRSILIKANDE